jgi:hypothetical protein
MSAFAPLSGTWRTSNAPDAGVPDRVPALPYSKCVATALARYGKIANARAGKPRPLRTFGQVTTISAPFGGTLSRFAITSIW